MLLVLALTWSLLPLPAAASPQSAPRGDTRNWYTAYEDAKKAIDKLNYKKALVDLQVAVERGPKPGRRVATYGDGVIAYTPDYYRGLAYLGLKQYAEADAAFKNVGNLIVKGDKEYDQFLASAETAAFEVLFDQAEQAMTKQQPAQAKQLATDARAHARGANVARLTAFIQKIDNALASAPAPVPEARGTAPATPPVDPNPPAATPPGTPNTGTNTAPPATATPPPATAAPTTPIGPTPTGTSRDTGSTTPTSTPPVRPPSPSTTGPAYAPPQSPAEGLAIERFYSGDYVGAASSLKALADGAALTPRGFFYLACSRAAMVLVGAAGESGLADARAALNTAGNASQFSADIRFISPRVRQSLGLER